MPVPTDDRVLIDFRTADDAGVFALEGGTEALVQTVDFFTPIVDDPFAYGRIAGANALSDVYAMGGRPITALAIAAFPARDFDSAIVRAIFAGGLSALQEAGVALLGGHTVQDSEVKFGYAVTGLVDVDAVWSNGGARPGDVLVLTKPLGTGILATALKRDALIEAGMADAVRSMTTLNEGAARAALAVGVSAATDVTGFGLLGHLGNILTASKVGAELAFAALPILPHALNLAHRGIVPGGTQRNLQAAEHVAWADDVTPTERLLCVDAQTSGGLLLAVPPENEAALLAALREAETPAAAVIGRLTAGPTGHIRVTRTLA
jgi:selenide,water dikinase